MPRVRGLGAGVVTRLLRRLRCALGMHRWATLYGDLRDGSRHYMKTTTCIFCGRETK